MDKSTHFFGQSIFGQFISMIDTRTISRNNQKHKVDHYVKRFTAKGTPVQLPTLDKILEKSG